MTTISAPSTRDKISVSFLVASNIVPLIGVLFWDWNVGSILLMYWFENIVIGVYNAVKMAMSPLGKEEPQYVTDTTLKWSLIGFFVLHYGGFCAGHGVFVYLLYKISYGEIGTWPFIVAALSLFASHGISFFQNFIEKKEYTHTTVQQLMFEPYKRIVLIHVVILIGGGATFILGEPLFALIVLILLKIGLDIKMHQKEHKKLQTEPSPTH
ncbi:MAG TPA: hypothetical protein DCS29_02330 [Candidatus Magasanikbacteria bacterium]|nr:MAG: hypothetical protein A2479_02685 [Candidatus Magasanikbacteria bacterium RIFOXYC2_FULL_39_8]HAT03594.1 hypothetical protein [Candidatus Magasanikbacteria bacterium]